MSVNKLEEIANKVSKDSSMHDLLVVIDELRTIDPTISAVGRALCKLPTQCVLAHMVIELAKDKHRYFYRLEDLGIRRATEKGSSE